MRRCRPINMKTFTPLLVNAVFIPGPPDVNMCHFTGDAYRDIFNNFPSVFKRELCYTNPGAAVKHGVYHHIKMTGPSVHSHFRRLRPEMPQAAKLAFTEMERMGVCTKAPSPWASPFHMVRKLKKNSCGDYRRLSLITELDHYPMPNINDFDSQHRRRSHILKT